MSHRLAFINPLVDHLKTDSTLTFTGGGRYVFVMDNFQGVTRDNQVSPAIWVIPLAGGPAGAIASRFEDTCKTMVKQRVLISVAVYNARDKGSGYGWSADQAPETYLGAYPEASGYEELVRASVLNLNKKVYEQNLKAPFANLRLVELPAPVTHNGHLILHQIYETEFSF